MSIRYITSRVQEKCKRFQTGYFHNLPGSFPYTISLSCFRILCEFLLPPGFPWILSSHRFWQFVGTLFSPCPDDSSHMHYLNFFADQPVYFFQNFLIYIRFFWDLHFCIHYRSSLLPEVCPENIHQKVTAILKGLQASHSGTYIIGVKAGQCSNFNHTASLACSTKSFRILSYSPSPFRTVCTS